jgi:hypothetical protein
LKLWYTFVIGWNIVIVLNIKRDNYISLLCRRRAEEADFLVCNAIASQVKEQQDNLMASHTSSTSILTATSAAMEDVAAYRHAVSTCEVVLKGNANALRGYKEHHLNGEAADNDQRRTELAAAATSYVDAVFEIRDSSATRRLSTAAQSALDVSDTNVADSIRTKLNVSYAGVYNITNANIHAPRWYDKTHVLTLDFLITFMHTEFTSGIVLYCLCVDSAAGAIEEEVERFRNGATSLDGVHEMAKTPLTTANPPPFAIAAPSMVNEALVLVQQQCNWAVQPDNIKKLYIVASHAAEKDSAFLIVPTGTKWTPPHETTTMFRMPTPRTPVSSKPQPNPTGIWVVTFHVQ